MDGAVMYFEYDVESGLNRALVDDARDGADSTSSESADCPLDLAIHDQICEYLRDFQTEQLCSWDWHSLEPSPVQELASIPLDHFRREEIWSEPEPPVPSDSDKAMVASQTMCEIANTKCLFKAAKKVAPKLESLPRAPQTLREGQAAVADAIHRFAPHHLQDRAFEVPGLVARIANSAAQHPCDAISSPGVYMVQYVRTSKRQRRSEWTSPGGNAVGCGYTRHTRTLFEAIEPRHLECRSYPLNTEQGIRLLVVKAMPRRRGAKKVVGAPKPHVLPQDLDGS